MTAPALFNELVSNAFDFLETAFDEFDKKPKYSVVHFCTAVELILKARLMHEHWSLIVDGKPDINKFRDGNFKSLNFKELIPRIEDVLNEKIPEDAKKSFDSIANHRNKMVHFFHEADDPIKSEKIKQEIAIEQSTGWFFLRRLLEKWSDVFKNYNQKIASLNYMMKSHHVYLQTVFEKIEPEIKKEIKNGAIYRACSSCSFKASKEKPLTDHLLEAKCRVCLIKEWILKVKCPECDEIIEISEYNADTQINCSCGQVIDTEIIKDQLDTNPVTTDNYFDHVEVNCAYCMEHGSVIEHQDYWICTSCYSVDEKMSICGWCSEGQIGGGDMEYSYHTGCEFCDGQAGWVKDD